MSKGLYYVYAIMAAMAALRAAAPPPIMRTSQFMISTQKPGNISKLKPKEF